MTTAVAAPAKRRRKAEPARTSLTEDEVAAFMADLLKIERRSRSADYDKACLAKRVSDVLGHYARRAMVSQLGMSSGAVTAYMRRLEDLHVVSDRRVWIAVGWGRVRQIASIEQAKTRGVVIDKVLAAADRFGIAPDWSVREILAAHVAESGEGRRGRGALVSKALAELKYILENYTLSGYAPPPDVVRLVGAKV